jgi:hypothetical protein
MKMGLRDPRNPAFHNSVGNADAHPLNGEWLAARISFAYNKFPTLRAITV